MTSHYEFTNLIAQKFNLTMTSTSVQNSNFSCIYYCEHYSEREYIPNKGFQYSYKMKIIVPIISYAYLKSWLGMISFVALNNFERYHKALVHNIYFTVEMRWKYLYFTQDERDLYCFKYPNPNDAVVIAIYYFISLIPFIIHEKIF